MTMFQPVGGMDMIGKAFARELGELIHYDAKVTQIQQGDDGVTVTYVNAKDPAAVQVAKADWCVCTIPLAILSQIPIDVGAPMKAAIDAVPYLFGHQDRLAIQAPVLGRRRGHLWRHQLHGFADPANRLSDMGFNRSGRGVLLGAYLVEDRTHNRDQPQHRASRRPSRFAPAPQYSTVDGGRCRRSSPRGPQ